jgi:hypothetical protein
MLSIPAQSADRGARTIDGIRLHFFVGGVEYPRCPHCWIEARRGAPLSRAGLTLPDPLGTEAKRLAREAAVEIRLGYRGDEPARWSGTVEWVRPGTIDQIEIGVAGGEKALSTARITQAWQNETPARIVRHAIEAAGLPVGRIDAPAGVTLPRFIASNISPWNAIEQVEHSCRRAFGLDMAGWRLWVDASGAVNWGDFEDESGQGFVAASDGNLITHSPATDARGQGVVQTFLAPAVWPGQTFQLRDARRGTNQKLRVLAVRHDIRGVSARTWITYGVEHAKY